MKNRQYLKNARLHFLVICLLFFTNHICAQQKDSVRTGQVKGKVKDSVYKFMLVSATVAVYRNADSNLLQFTLPNSFGEFTIQPLPLDVPLHLIITHVGYKPLFKSFVLDKAKSIVDVGLLYMYQDTGKNSNMLEEVVVRNIAPMRMKGDTLEFNADAFKMDPNATAEDLMRRLPGITIWGDGEITFNGKKINAVLVEGKPFMGSTDVTIATQNLPKDALDKVQIYQQPNEKNPLDSTMFANIKLKEDKKSGYFGKASGGYGVSGVSSGKDKRYAADGMFSGFNRKLQITSVAAGNNVNKVAGNVDALLRTSSYKGEGNSLEYQSDFNMRGVNKPIMGGARLQYDFIADVKYQKSSRLNADYFINHNNTLIENTNLEKNFITADTVLTRQSYNNSLNRSNDQRMSARYQGSTEKYMLSLNASAIINEDENRNENDNSQDKTGVGIINNNSSTSQSHNIAKNITAGFSFTKREPYKRSGGTRRIPTEFTIDYSLSSGDNKGSAQSQTIYEFTYEPKRNRKVSRIYHRRDGNSTGHNFSISYPHFRQLIFGKTNFGGIDIGLHAKYNLRMTGNNEQARDLDTLTGNYVPNTGLSYNRTITIKDFMPSVSLSKDFHKDLTNRYSKYVSLNFNAVQQYYSYAGQSTQAQQNITYRNIKFVPNASVEYNNHQYGSYEANYSLNYSSKATYPTINQLAPLIDLTNPLYLPMGNRYLKPEYRQDISFEYKFTTRKPKNPWNIDAGITIGKTTDNIVDSTVYDDGGGRTVYMTNIDGNKYLNSNLSIKKSLSANKNNTFELGLRYNFDLYNDPRYIDNLLNISVNRDQGGSFNISYRHRDLVNLKIEQGLSYNNAEQRGFNNNRFKSNYRYSRAIASLQLPRDLTWSTNITNNRSEAGKSDAVSFTIWNASLTYRFLKGNNGEVKFSALDLLRQNKGVTVGSSGNVQHFGYTNVLQQYFMLTLAYYPRKFGKKIN